MSVLPSGETARLWPALHTPTPGKGDPLTRVRAPVVALTVNAEMVPSESFEANRWLPAEVETMRFAVKSAPSCTPPAWPRVANGDPEIGVSLPEPSTLKPDTSLAAMPSLL